MTAWYLFLFFLALIKSETNSTRRFLAVVPVTDVNFAGVVSGGTFTAGLKYSKISVYGIDLAQNTHR